MRPPQQRRSSASTEAMVRAVLDLLAEGGLPAVTVAAVAQRAGTSNGALYHRFGDRQGLLLEAQAQAFEVIGRETADAFATAVEEPDGDAALRLLAAAALRIFTDHRPVLRAFLVEAQSDPVLEERSEAAVHLLAGAVTGWLRAHLGAGEAAAEASWRLIYALAVSQALFDDAQVSPTPVDREVLARALAGSIAAVVRA